MEFWLIVLYSCTVQEVLVSAPRVPFPRPLLALKEGPWLVQPTAASLPQACQEGSQGHQIGQDPHLNMPGVIDLYRLYRTCGPGWQDGSCVADVASDCLMLMHAVSCS
jgi:hypothetical protein